MELQVAVHVETEEDFHITLDYLTSTLQKEEALKIAHTFRHILLMIEQNPSKSLRELDLCSKQDVAQLAIWNEQRAEPSRFCVHDVIEKQCVEYPDNLAVSAWDGNMTYKELVQLSSNVAAHLQMLGVGPETFVPLCFEKSKWAVVALLGVMKAGGAYVFLDPEYPIVRMRSICDDLGANLLLSSAKNVSLGEKLVSKVVCIPETDHFIITNHQQQHEIAQVQPRNALYAVFTSGSTGKPKGVTIEHGAFYAAAMANGPALHLARTSKVLQFANYVYDVSNRDMLLTLLFGGCVCVPSESERYDDLSAFISRHQVNWASLTPSTVSLLSPSQVPTLRHLVLGGEPMTPSQPAFWAEKLILMNAYGPCECAAISSLRSSIQPDSDHKNIGRGIGSVMWIVAIDDHNRLAPIGAIGELVIESAGVGRGYINQESDGYSPFLPTTSWLGQFRRRPHARLFKTGDLVRHEMDGTITFIGRKDTQVKIRGQRVELGEVQHHVQQVLGNDTPAVTEVIMPCGSDDARLVVFVMLAAPVLRQMAQGVKERMMEQLPTYMVPSALIPIERIPLTATGKTDRRHLRETGRLLTLDQLAELQQPWEALNGQCRPITEMERRLQELWASVLNINVRTIGRNNSFLQIGGDSIAVMRLVGAARSNGLFLVASDVFQAPRLAELAQVVAVIDGHHNDAVTPFSLLEPDIDLADARAQAATRCRLGTAAQVEDLMPCTPLQEGLMAMTARRTGDYVNQTVLKLAKHVNILDYQKAWAEVIRTVPILRSRIIDLPCQGMVQVIIAEDYQWVREKNLDHYLRFDSQQSMGLGTPLLRFGLVEDHSQNDMYFVWTLHHALYDGWCKPLILEQVRKIYHGERVEPIAPFQSFIQYIKQCNENVDQYWQTQFADSEAGVFPTLPSPGYQPQADRILEHNLTAIDWPRNNNITASTAVRAAWAILTAHYTGSLDVIFGAMVTGRQAPVAAIERTGGPTISTVPVRVKLDLKTEIIELLQQVQAQAVKMIPFEHTGLQRIRRITAASQFQTLLVVQPVSSVDAIRGEDGLFSPIGFESKHLTNELNAFNTYALMLECQLMPKGLKVRLSFDSKVVEESQAWRILRQLEHLLQQVCAKEGEKMVLQDLDAVNSKDIDMIWTWNRVVPAAVQTCVHTLIMKRCQQQPLAPAVCAWDGDLTYSQLDRLSTALAHHLIHYCRIKPGIIVPLCFEKSMWMSVAMLGVIKTGGASVAMDVTQPTERLQSIIERVKPTTILTSLALREFCGRIAAAKIIVVGPHSPEDLQLAGGELVALPDVAPTETLYLSFTSGSTGRPKGAILTHANVASSIHYQQRLLGFNAASRVLDFASYSFDVAWLNFFHAFTSGACLCVPSESARKNNLSSFIRQTGATIACLTSSTVRLLDPAAVTSLQTLILAGEAMQANDILTWASRLRLKNWYGPTECVSSTVQEVITHSSQANNIGRGLGLNTWVVAFSEKCLAPIGAIGELWLEGPLVGQGYIQEPEKTAATFTQDPLWLQNGLKTLIGASNRGRLYKTGDLVRYNPDGTLVFIGRKDAQVKIRGQRVELEEVEHYVRLSLVNGVNVQIAAEVITPRGSINQVLVVYLGIGEEAHSSPKNVSAVLQHLTQGVKEKLADQLPVYMIPSAYIVLDSIPLIITGKINRRQLREIGESLTLEQIIELQPAEMKFSGPPETDMEKRLQHLWASILKVKAEGIRRDDSFLRIGGDSIGAMQLVASAREQGLSLSVTDIFTRPRLCELAQLLEAGGLTEHAVEPFTLLPSVISIPDARAQAAAQCGVQNSQIEDLFPCTPLQAGLLALTARRPGDYVGRIVLELQKDVDIVRFRRAWEEVIATKAPILRTRIVDLPGAGLLQVIVAQNMEWVTSQDLPKCMEPQEQSVMGLGTPLIRFYLAEDHCRRFLVWKQHHAVYDRWTTPLILNLVEKVYHGTTIKKIATFQNFIQHITKITNVNQYWQAQLGESEAQIFPSLPFLGYEPNADQVCHHEILALQWARTDITASNIVRAAWAILVARYTSSSDVTFGALVSGRQAPVLHVELMTGPTAAAVPIRIHIHWDQTVESLLGQIQRQATDMVQFEQMGLQRIRKISLETEQACRFQTFLVVQPASQNGEANCKSELFKTEISEHHSESESRLNLFNSYALMLACQLRVDGMKMQISFDSRVIQTEQVERITQQLEHVIRQLCETGANRLIAEVECTSKEDLGTIWNWNAEVPKTVQLCVHDLIAEQTMQQPNAPAICAWDGNLTYHELDRLSTKLAYRLIECSVGQDTIVPLCFEKSKWVPVAMLGVMKAGGASVAMDVTQPEERLQLLIKQIDPIMILCSASKQELAARLNMGNVGVVDEAQLENLPVACHQVLPKVEPSSKLCIVFTSGSTGTPKGAILTHSNFSSAIVHQQKALGFDSPAQLRVFDFASYAFDAAWSNFVHSASSGACLCIPSESERKDDIMGAMTRMAVTYADLTPSTARLLDPAIMTSFCTLIMAGEAITPQDIDFWCSKLTLKNTYGPAECTITATGRTITDTSGQVGNIGRGLGFATWVVEPAEGNRLAPIGAVGELWLEGPLVGQGYLRDPRRTAASFIEDPIWLLQGAPGFSGRRGRLYNTGDLVRYESDGTLIFIGRNNDSQIKIRGQRVELGDVEHHVRQNFPGAWDTVVEVVKPASDQQAPLLAAFVCCAAVGDNGNGDITTVLAPPNQFFRSQAMATETRLCEILPSYMIPTIFLPLRRVPTTATGKTDRRGLRERTALIPRRQLMSYSHLLTHSRGPSTQMEHTLQQLWAQVLNVEPAEIGVDDSFFRLGGDSISAMRLSAKCLAAGFRITVSQIFNQKTLARLALSMSRPKDVKVSTKEQLNVPFALSPMQQMFFETQPHRYNCFSQSFLLRVTRAVLSTDVIGAVKSTVERHSMLRARFSQATNGSWSQTIVPSVDGCYRYREHKVMSLQHASHVFNASEPTLDIQKGPLFEVNLINTCDDEQYLFLVAHHLVIDLVSWRILLEDLEGFLVKRSPDTDPLPFQTWCHLQAQYSHENLIPEKAFPFEIEPMPYDYWGRELQQNTYEDIEKCAFTIDKHTSESLLGPANTTYGTQPVEIFQAALWHSFVDVFADRPGPTIFNEGHGRESWDDAIDISRTVGWFTTIWPTNISVDRGQNITETVRRTKDGRRRVPRNGWAYFTSRYLNPQSKEMFKPHNPVEILFNYEGRYQKLERHDALFHLVDREVDGPAEVLRGLQRSALIEVTVSAIRGQIRFSFWYNRYMKHQDSIVKWIENCRQCLEEMATHLPRLRGSYTLCDFPLLNLTYKSLDQFLNEKLSQVGHSPTDIESAYPCLSFQQLMMKSHVEDRRLYATTFIGKIRAAGWAQPINMSRLKHAWQSLVDRHSCLRTIFMPIITENEWDQIVLRKVAARILEVQCPQDEALKSLTAQPPLENDCKNVPYQLSLYQMTTGEVMFRFDISHAIMDAVSQSVLFDEWSQFYMDQMPCARSIPYEDHVKYVLSIQHSATRYWVDYLKTSQPCLFPVSTTTLYKLGELKTTRIPSGEKIALSVFSRKYGITIPTLIKTVWALILQNWVDTKFVCFGYLDSGRHVPVAGIQTAVGPFLNMLVCCVQVEQNLRIGDILESIHQDYYKSISHSSGAIRALDLLNLHPPSQYIFNTLINYRSEQPPISSEQSNLNFDFISGEDGMEVSFQVAKDSSWAAHG